MIDNAKKINIHVKNASLANGLDLCCKDQSFTYQIIGKTVVLKQREPSKKNEDNETATPVTPITVHGKVVNEKNVAMEALSVVVKKTGRGAATDNKGEFTLENVDPNATIVVRGLNIDIQEVKVNNRTDIAIYVQTKETQLADISISAPIYTGYQKTSAERFVGSTSVLDSTAYARREGMGIIERLDGTVTGLVFDKKNTINDLRKTI